MKKHAKIKWTWSAEGRNRKKINEEETERIGRKEEDAEENEEDKEFRMIRQKEDAEEGIGGKEEDEAKICRRKEHKE